MAVAGVLGGLVPLVVLSLLFALVVLLSIAAGGWCVWVGTENALGGDLSRQTKEQTGTAMTSKKKTRDGSTGISLFE